NFLNKINFFINFCISSLEDLCLYNLRLNVEPGAYYQLPIPFKIDQNDLDEPFEPNYAKLSKLLEEKCFENGSMKKNTTNLLFYCQIKENTTNLLFYCQIKEISLPQVSHNLLTLSSNLGRLEVSSRDVKSSSKMAFSSGALIRS
ncbi:hypothetical protein BpHYR1_024586, partial [Brachionus plicatilis]